MSDKLSQDDIDKLLNAIGEPAEASSSSSVPPGGTSFFTEEEIRELPLHSSILFPGGIISTKEFNNKQDAETSLCAWNFLERQEKGIFRIGGCECGYLPVTPTCGQKGKIIVHTLESGEVDTGEIRMTLQVQLSTISLPGESGEPVRPGTDIPFEMFNPGEPVMVRANEYPLCYAEVLVAGEDFAVRLMDKVGSESSPAGAKSADEALVLLGTKELTLQEIRSFTEGTILILDRRNTDPLDIEYRGDLLFQGYIVASENGFAVRVAGSPEFPGDTAGHSAEKKQEVRKEVKTVPGRTLSGPRFSFLTPDDIPVLLSVLQDEPGDIISLVLSYIDSDIAGNIFSQLKPEQQVEAGRIIAEGRPVDRSLADVLESELYKLLRG